MQHLSGRLPPVRFSHLSVFLVEGAKLNFIILHLLLCLEPPGASRSPQIYSNDIQHNIQFISNFTQETNNLGKPIHPVLLYFPNNGAIAASQHFPPGPCWLQQHWNLCLRSWRSDGGVWKISYGGSHFAECPSAIFSPELSVLRRNNIFRPKDKDEVGPSSPPSSPQSCCGHVDVVDCVCTCNHNIIFKWHAIPAIPIHSCIWLQYT